MTTFVASKFDAENDPSRPKVGEEVEYWGRKYKIAEVEAIVASDLMKSIMAGKEPDLRGHDQLLYRDHPTRAVKWACWVDVSP